MKNLILFLLKKIDSNFLYFIAGTIMIGFVVEFLASFKFESQISYLTFVAFCSSISLAYLAYFHKIFEFEINHNVSAETIFDNLKFSNNFILKYYLCLFAVISSFILFSYLYYFSYKKIVIEDSKMEKKKIQDSTFLQNSILEFKEKEKNDSIKFAKIFKKLKIK